jgi:hypothetical protein
MGFGYEDESGKTIRFELMKSLVQDACLGGFDGYEQDGLNRFNMGQHLPLRRPQIDKNVTDLHEVTPPRARATWAV